MAYEVTDWGNQRRPPINAEALTKIEQGIKEAHDLVESRSGTSVTLGLPVTSASALPATGTPGEGRIAQDTGHLWQWDGTTWVDMGNVQGPPVVTTADRGVLTIGG